jgi:hypothetical protein
MSRPQRRKVGSEWANPAIRLGRRCSSRAAVALVAQRTRAAARPCPVPYIAGAIVLPDSDLRRTVDAASIATG